MKPSIGRIVHFWIGSNQGKPCAALVTNTHSEDRVDLTVFSLYDFEVFTRVYRVVPRGDDGYGWAWPERV